MKNSVLSLTLVVAGVAAQAQSPAQTATEVERLDTVTVGLLRDPGIIRYAQINALLSGLHKHGEGLFRMDFKLGSRDPAKPLVEPKLAVQSNERALPVPISAEGLLSLPLLPPAEARDADLASNQPKDSIAVTGTIHLTTPPEALDMGTVRRIVRVAHILRSELLPWYLRWLFPQIEGVRICSKSPDWQLAWPEDGQMLAVPLSADPRTPTTSKGGSSKPCTSLTGREGWPDAARLLAPADAELSVRLRQ